MRILLTLAAALLVLTCASARPDSTSPPADDMQTLIPAGDLRSGGFGAPVIKVGSINGETSVMFGGRGGWVINRTLVIGGGGYGFTDMMYHRSSSSADTGISFGYGGLELEYLVGATNVVHGSFLLLIGGGGFAVTRRMGMSDPWDDDYSTLYSQACFVLEPAVNVEVNILSWLRLAAGVGYRFVSGISDVTIGARSYNNSSVSGVFGVGTLKFGPY